MNNNIFIIVIIVFSQFFLGGFIFAQVNQPPTFSAFNQYKSDSQTPITEGQTITESTIIFKAMVSDPDNDKVKLQVELKEFEQDFNGQDILESDFVDSGSQATITRTDLVNGKYKWKARAMDEKGAVSGDWQEFGTVGNVDFEVVLTPIYNIAVILAEPGDKSFEPRHNKAYFEGIIDQVKDYYCENAFGKWSSVTKTCDGGVFNLNVRIFDNDGLNYKLASSQEYYGKDFSQVQEISLGLDGNGREIKLKDQNRTEQFVWDAINKADEDIDYNNYQGVIVIYRGDSRQKIFSLQENRLYTQWWTPFFSPSPVNSSGEFISNWISISENETKYAWAHELGHALGEILRDAVLCDLYPPSPKIEPCSYEGSVVDYFDVMGARTVLWGLVKDTTSYFSSFTKIKLGWLKEKVVGHGNYTIESLETMKFDDEVIRYNASPNSYYLLEARTNNFQYSRWDRDVPENDPLVVYRVSPKEITVNGQPIVIDSVNISKAIGAYFLDPFPLLDPFDLPFKDPVNKVLITINNRIAEPSSFRINAQISEYSPLRYIGIILRPKLNLLEKILGIGVTPRKAAMPRGPGGEQYLHIFGYKIKQIYEFPAVPYLSSIQKLLWYLLILFILILFPLWLCVRRRIPRRIILWIIISLAIIFIILRFFVSFVAASNLDDSASSRGVLYESFPADLDLHAYDDQGHHVGINYETGEYENQVPNAEASGDLVYDDEWIFVPEGTDVRFVVSSKDIYNMLEAEPELKELTDGIETYEIQAIHYDEISQRYESNIITEQIIPGINQDYLVRGAQEETQIERRVTASNLIAEIEIGRQLNLIDNDGTKNSLIKKLNNAQKQIELNKNKSAINILNAFINEVEAQKGKHINSDFAELLIKDAQYLIKTLQPLVSTGNKELVNTIIATTSAILIVSGIFVFRRNHFLRRK